MQHSGRVALVTGGAGGIGSAVAARLAQHGVAVVIADLRLDVAQQAADRLAQSGGAPTFAVAGDVTRSEDASAIVAAAVEAFGRLDHVVNCAGMSLDGPSDELSDAEWTKVLDLNLTGTFYVCRAAASELAKTKGTIVNFSSIAAFAAGRPERHAGYDASKAAIIALTRTLGVEWASRGVRVNAVAPGYTNTQMLRDVGSADPATMRSWLDQTPAGRLCEPEEIAEVVAFLSSAASSAITAQTILADGGYSASK